jgi:RHS repeat-associated protein
MSSPLRTTGITYDATWVHLPSCITTTGDTVAFVYNSTTGNMQTRAETDTASGGTACATSSATHTRVWTYNTYTSTGQLEKITDPLSNVTQYAYSGGILTSITDALSQVTTINTYTNGGQPTKTTDPNSVIRTYTYAPYDGGLQKKLTSTVDTSGGNYTTTYGYDSAGNLTRITMPDSTYSSYTYDNAHRLTKITNANSEYISYTLDELGGRTVSDIYNSSSTLTRKHTATFDALGRMLTDIVWSTTSASMTTTYAYDKNGNATSIEDPRSHTQTQHFDALNRRYQVSDRLSHTTTTTYDAHDRPLTVVDPNSHTTTYTRDGFGRATQIASPDSGTSTYVYDFDDNMTKKTDGATIVTNRTFDALNRELTRTFPADTTQNVSKTYDQSGTISGFNYGFGVGHLTTMTDNAGTMHRQFEERGDITHNQRLDGTAQIDTYAGFDQNNRQWEFVYPDQWMLLYYRDNAGQLTEIDSIQQSGSWVYTGGVPVVSSVTHAPFGPVSGLSFHNGLTKTNTMDLDYRITETKDAGSSNVMDLQYTYDANGNPTAIADTVNAANGQSSITADNDDRLTGSTSGTGGYGVYAWTYDSDGNRSTETLNGGTAITYSYNSGTNQIASLTDSTSTNYVYNGAGEITKQYYGSYYDLAYAFNTQEQLYTPTYQGYGSPSAYFYYNGFGQREGKSASVYWAYSYDLDGRVAQEWSAGGQLADYVYLDGQFVALNEITGYYGGSPTEATYYVSADRLGIPQTVTNGSKAVSWQQFYDPFGFPYSNTNTANIVQDLGFPGQLDDAEDDVAYNGARYYNYLTGSYIQTDPIGLGAGTPNTYTYANSNPFRFTDESGLDINSNDFGQPVPIGSNNGLPAPPSQEVTVQVVDAVLSSDGMGSALRCDRMAVTR